MPPELLQPDEMTPEEAKASLGIATRLMEQMMPQSSEAAQAKKPSSPISEASGDDMIEVPKEELDAIYKELEDILKANE
mgnify:CR=1 FL=1